MDTKNDVREKTGSTYSMTHTTLDDLDADLERIELSDVQDGDELVYATYYSPTDSWRIQQHDTVEYATHSITTTVYFDQDDAKTLAYTGQDEQVLYKVV